MFCHRLYRSCGRCSKTGARRRHRSRSPESPGDPHQTLLDILGLHSGSVEWYSTLCRGADHALQPVEPVRDLETESTRIFEVAQRQNAIDLLVNLGFGGAGAPKILDYVFSAAPQLLKGGVVDDRPLSELRGDQDLHHGAEPTTFNG